MVLIRHQRHCYKPVYGVVHGMRAHMDACLHAILLLTQAPMQPKRRVAAQSVHASGFRNLNRGVGGILARARCVFNRCRLFRPCAVTRTNAVVS